MRIALILSLLALEVSAQNLILKGYIIDDERNRVKNATVELVQGNTAKRTISDTSGYFYFIVKPGNVKITIEHIAYKRFQNEFEISTDTLIFIQLQNRIIKFGEVTVTATRYQANTADLSNFVEIINSKEIKKISPNSFADVLRFGTSIYIRDYGGTPAQLKTMSLRGTGSEHTVFLLNGMRISSYQNGVLDLSLIPVDVIERLELIHSNLSSLYGADAIGGVVNIVTKGKDDKSGEVNLFVGSFGQRKFNLNVSGSIKNFNYISTFSRTYGTGDFDYKYKLANDYVVLKRKNAHFNISNLYLGVSNHNLSFSALYVRSNRGIPAPTVKFDPTSTANQFDEDLNLSFSASKAFSSSILKASLFLKNSYLRYINNDVIIAGSGIDSYSHNLFYSGVVNLIFKTKFNFLISTGIETSFGVAEGNSFEKAKRLNIASFVSGEKGIEIKFLPAIKIYSMLRNDHFSDFGNKLVYKVGINSGILRKPNLNFKFSYGTGFRAPTFNDLYWAGSGNKNLKPESSKGFDLGISIFSESNRKFLPDFKFEISLFNIDITNRIVWLPSKENQNIWKPINIDEVNSKGVEVYGEVALFEKLKIKGNFSIAHSIRKNKRTSDDATQNKHLIYIPLSTGNILIDLNFNKLFFLVQFNYVGLRYTTETNDRWLQPYYVVDFVSGFNYQVKLFEGEVKFSVKNLLNENYETMVGYPMPLRNYSLEFSFGLKNQTKQKEAK